MTNGDEWFFSISFGIMTAIMWAIRVRLKRVEEKLDKLTGK